MNSPHVRFVSLVAALMAGTALVTHVATLAAVRRKALSPAGEAPALARSPTGGSPGASRREGSLPGKGACGAAAATNVSELSALEIERVDYDGDKALRIVFNRRPDVTAARHYVSVDALRGGTLSFGYEPRGKSHGKALRVTGDFAFRTNVTLRVRKGYPPFSGEALPPDDKSLARDFCHVFRRPDPRPSIAFADAGRYLPPGGRDAVRIESLHVKEIATEIRRVEPRNVVQLLAREERVYRADRWWPRAADDEETAELSGACVTSRIACANRLCEKEEHLLPVRMADGGPARGVFLAMIRDGDREDSARYRLVCLSDLGLSVRRWGDRVGVWVTSLRTGQPAADVSVDVYSSANILLATGTTDANGWCEAACGASSEPFAVVAWSREDMTFLALRGSMETDETCPDGARPAYLQPRELDAFAWTERGIYRHGERIFVHGLVRNGTGRAPAEVPLVLRLVNPKGLACVTKTVVTDAEGAFADESLAATDEQPSGLWKVVVALPGKNGRALATRVVKVEAFAPPQIRVLVADAPARHPTNFAFTVSAEHLFGGPAAGLACEGEVQFEDAPFAPARWKGYSFGNDDLGLKPAFRRLGKGVLDARGAHAYRAPLLAESGLPKAAVRATGQGVVFEDGGRPAVARQSQVLHFYPFYIGANLAHFVKLPVAGTVFVDLVCVDPDGRALAEPRCLTARVERIETSYACTEKADGRKTWTCSRLRSLVAEGLAVTTDAAGRARLALPLAESGEYALTVTDAAARVSFGKTFYLSHREDRGVRAPLGNPTEIALEPDRAVYRIGDVPRLLVKAPFAGQALLTVMREELVHREILALTNATCDIALPPVVRTWAPNVDVSLSVVQGVAASAQHLATRAHGQATLRVRPGDAEIAVTLRAKVRAPESASNGASRVCVSVAAPGATSAVVTLVDEGVNLLTDEPVPDPVAWFARPRTANHPLFDLYHRILPVAGEGVTASGVKTGGGFGAELFRRVSPVPTRRFRPLALWKGPVALTNGAAQVAFDLPEFVGEVRVTAVAYSSVATGAAAVRAKVAPNLVLQADAPRFVAPGDRFAATMTLRNLSAADGRVAYAFGTTRGEAFLAKGASTNLVFADCRGVPADGRLMGPMTLRFRAEGLGERHESVLELPVRPAAAWRTEAEVVALAPGATLTRCAAGLRTRFSVQVGASPLADCAPALQWLADYPHGCLEQTTSRVFPLIAAGGILQSAVPGDVPTKAYVEAGVRRIESMACETDFTMWPGGSFPPWNRDVSLYAAHFLFEAEKAGFRLTPAVRARVLGFLRKWALCADEEAACYACQVLARIGAPERDRMFRLYDRRTDLTALARARLARAFVSVQDRARAEALMRFAVEPQSVKEAAFRVLALLDLDPEDARLPALVQYLGAHRDRTRLDWGTTETNAHALLALGAYGLCHPVTPGVPRVEVSAADGAPRTLAARETFAADADALRIENSGKATAFLTIRRQHLPRPEELAPETNGIGLVRRHYRADGTLADLGNLRRGDLLIVELSLTSDVTRTLSDLVVEDLFAGAFEPVHRAPDLQNVAAAQTPGQAGEWVLRTDARDDRMLVFSKRFTLEKGHEVKMFYAVRVVSKGTFVLPGATAEGMYHPGLRARLASRSVVVRD